MLSEFEYTYFEPGAKRVGRRRRTTAGRPAAEERAATLDRGPELPGLAEVGDAARVRRRLRGVTFDQASGSSGRTSPMVSSSLSVPSATADSSTAPLTALATLARRMWSSIFGGVDVSMSASPPLWNVISSPRWTTTVTRAGHRPTPRSSRSPRRARRRPWQRSEWRPRRPPRPRSPARARSRRQRRGGARRRRGRHEHGE